MGNEVGDWLIGKVVEEVFGYEEVVQVGGFVDGWGVGGSGDGEKGSWGFARCWKCYR